MMLAALLAASMLQATATSDEPKRIALIIGVSDYQHFTERGAPGRSDLRGPRNDVIRIIASLRRFGFEEGPQMLVLQDSQASRAGIADGFRWLSQQATSERDVVVIFYAGHGSNTPDADGDEATLQRGDKYDEALVPWDARDIRNANELVTDDSLKVWLARLRTRNVTVIIDACYSGTVTRDIDGAVARGPTDPPENAVSQPVAAHPLMTDLPYVVITGAHAGQTAKEAELLPLPESYVGVFTYHFTRALDVIGDDATYDDLVARVRLALLGQGARQVPQLEGAGAARLFGITGRIARRPFVEIQRPPLVQEFLPIGAAHGVRPGALFEVYDTAELTFVGYPHGRLRVDSVHIGKSFFTQLEPATPLPVGARAVLNTVPIGAEHLRKINVFVAPDAHPQIKRILSQFTFTNVVSDERLSHVRVEGTTDVQVRVHGQRLVQLDSAWLVKQGVAATAVRGSGTYSFAPLAAALCNPLQRAYAIEALERIDNPLPDPRLRVEVAFVKAGQTPAVGTSADTLFADEPYDVWFRLHGPPNTDLYFSATYAGYLEQPYTIYPDVAGMPQPISADDVGRWIKLPLRYGNEQRHNGPFGMTQLQMYLGTTQFDFHRFEQTIPACFSSGTRTTPQQAAGWLKATHTLYLMPAR